MSATINYSYHGFDEEGNADYTLDGWVQWNGEIVTIPHGLWLNPGNTMPFYTVIYNVFSLTDSKFHDIALNSSTGLWEANTYSASGVPSARSTWTWSESDDIILSQYMISDGLVIYSSQLFTPPKKYSEIADSVSITGVTNHYLATSASSGVTKNTQGWTITVQTMTATNQYLWNYETITGSNGQTISETDPIIIGRYGQDGQSGGTGRGIVSIIEHYQKSSSSSTPPSTWSDTMVVTDPVNKYLWNYETITYTSGNPEDTTKRIIGVHGATGDTGDTGQTGDTGATGPKGDTGISITGVVNHYLATNASSGVTKGTTGWTISIQTIDANKPYLWNYETINGSNGSAISESDPTIIGRFGKDGEAGGTGRGIVSITEHYQKSNSSSTPPATWSDTMVVTDPVNKYLWNYETITYTSGSPEDSIKRIIGVHGATGDTGRTGDTGDTGKGISTITEYYAVNNSTSAPADSEFSTTVKTPTVSNRYLWNYELITYTDASTKKLNKHIVAVYGNTGQTGSTGNDGVGISSITEYYALSTNTTAPSDSAFDTTVKVVTPTNKYLWNYELITYTDSSTSKSDKHIIGTYGDTGATGETGDTGRTGDKGDTGDTGLDANIWTSTADAVAPNYTFNISALTGGTGEPRVGDIILRSYYRYTITSVGSTTVLAGNRTSLRGAAGAAAYSYDLIVSHAAITKSEAGEYNPASIVLTATRGQGTTTAPASYSGRFQIETTTNNSTWNVEYTSSSDESSKTYTVPDDIIAIRCSLYLAGDTTTLLDQQTVPIVHDGAKGDTGESGATGATGTTGADGKDAYTIILSNESHTFAAGTSAAIAGTATSKVISYKGATQISCYAGSSSSATSISTGTTGLTCAITNNNSQNVTLTFSATTSLTTKSGTVSVPVVADGKSFTKIFTWSLSLTGDTGDTGATGATGDKGDTGDSITVSSTVYAYQLSTSGTTIPTGTWQTSPQAPTTTQFAWTRTTTTFSDGSTAVTYTVGGKVGTTGATGATGTSVTVSSTVYAYQLSTNGTTIPTGTWQNTPQAPTTTQFAWTRTTTTFSDGSTAVTYTVGGKVGQTGATGATGNRGTTWYSGIAIDGQSTSPTSYATGIADAIVGDHYLNTNNQNVYICTTGGDASTAKWIYEQNIKGEQGTTGATGSDGVNSYFHVKYSDDGGQTFTGNTGEDPGSWIGTYTNNVQEDSTDVGDYTWAKIKGEDAMALSEMIPYYLATNRATGVTTSDPGWTREVQTITAENKYLWVYYVNRYGEGESQPELITVTGDVASFEYSGDPSPVDSLITNIEPVQGGTGDPSPSNPCIISGYTGVHIYNAGSDLLSDITFSSGYYDADGSAKSSNNLKKTNEYIPVTPGVDYAVQAIISFGGEARLRVHEYDSNQTWLRQVYVDFALKGNFSAIWTASQDASYIRFSIPLYASIGCYENAFMYSIDWQTDVGIVYGGYVDVTRGKLIVDRASIDLGNIDWVKHDTRHYYYFDKSDAKPAPTNGTIISGAYCSDYIVGSYMDPYDNRIENCIGVSINSRFAIYDTYAATNDLSAASFKTYVTGKQFVYPLADPIEYDVTPYQIALLQGQNNIWADTGDVTVGYYNGQTVGIPYITGTYGETGETGPGAEFISGTQAASTRFWTGTSSSITELTDGLQITYWLPYASKSETAQSKGISAAELNPTETVTSASSNTWLKLTLADGTTTAWVPCYYGGTTRLTTHYGAKNSIRLTYKANIVSGVPGGWWADANYYSDTSYTRHSNYVVAGANGIRGRSLVMKDSQDTWTCFYQDAYKGTATTKTVYQGGFILGPILYITGDGTQTTTQGQDDYYNYKPGVNAGTPYDSYACDFRYSTNCGTTLTNNKAVYLVGTINSTDGLFYLDNPWYTQTIPSTEDGKIYVYIGDSYSTYQVYLNVENTPYQFYKGEFRKYSEVLTMKADEAAAAAQDDIDNLTIGSRNLYIIRDQVDGYLDTTPSTINPPSANTKAVTSGFIPVIAGDPYSIQAWTPENAGSQLDPWIGYAFYTDEDMSTYIESRVEHAGTDGEVYISLQNIIAPSTANYMRVSYRTFGDEKAHILVEHSNRLSDWTPAPEDVAEEINDVSEALDDLDNSLDPRGVFDRLTNNGNIEGLFLDEDTNGIYINASYINSGTLNADYIFGGTLTLGGSGGQRGSISMLDENNNVIGEWDKNGLRTDWFNFQSGSNSAYIGKGDSEGIRNVYIDDDSIDIRNGQDVLASFGETVIIGKTDGAHLNASSDRLSFQVGDNEVAYVSIDPETNDSVFYMTKAIVVQDLFFGMWRWQSRSNSNLALKWIGSD